MLKTLSLLSETQLGKIADGVNDKVRVGMEVVVLHLHSKNRKT